MPLAPLRTSTALVASLSLILPHQAFVAKAWAQEVELLCLDESDPPCPEGEPEEGSTPAERAEFAKEQAARLAAEAEQAAAEEAAMEAEARAAEEAAAIEAEARAAEEAAAMEAEARAAEEAAAIEAEARAAQEAAAMEAEARAAEEAAAIEAEARAAQEAAAIEAEARAAEEAAAMEAEARAAEEAAAIEAEARAAEEAAAMEAEARAAQEAAAIEAEARAAQEAAAIEAEARAAQEAAAIEAEARAAEEARADATALVDPTVADEDDAPVAATPDAVATPDEVVEEVIETETVRTSAQDFETAIDSVATSAAQDGGSSGLSNFEKALLLGLGVAVVGSVLRNGDRVVANTGDRVVVEGAQGFTVYKDDDALLRQPGATMRTETYSDGSSRTTLTRVDGSQVVTIRDSLGRVMRRAVVYPDGTQYELFDDLQPVLAVDVMQLQATRPAPRSLSVSESDLVALRAALREEMAFDAGRTFSLRQIREIEQVRSLVPAIDLDTVTFATGSAAIPADQARSLVLLGILIEEILAENPREVFLIEGHTDAVGNEGYNLALSDRRAESVALALTETFRIPPENLIVQGYGEAFLKVPTQAAEERNRRATVRRITPLLRQVAGN
ncbi:MAG: OmpA family protein [Rubellimicrobium sp.]|nr:OmpA family protein [Rubellimicrobium sp.]